MGHGYLILLWDGWGAGLVRINPRLHTEGEDMHGNPKNWWSCEKETTNQEILEKHTLPEGAYFKIIRD